MEPIKLTKGENINLSKAAPGVSRFVIGLGWDAAAPGGAKIDLDAAAFPCLTVNGSPHLASPAAKQFVFYGNLKSDDGAIIHHGDNLTGDGDGDDERITIDTSLLTAGVDQIIIGIAIYEAASRNQTFGLVQNAYARIYDEAALKAAEAGKVLSVAELNGLALAKYDLTEDAGGSTTFEFGTVYQKDGEWKFRATGKGSTGDFGTLLATLAPEVQVAR